MSKTHCHVNGCVPGLVLKQRQKATRKWRIYLTRPTLTTGNSSLVLVYLFSTVIGALSFIIYGINVN